MGKFKIKNNFLPSLEVCNGLYSLISNRTNYISSWYCVANENVKTAALLLQNERIPHAVFFLQQAIECVIKGMFLENGIAQRDEIEEISHFPNKAFRTYYTHEKDSYGVTFCDLLAKVIIKGQNFYEKLDISAQITNEITKEYNSNLNCEKKVIKTKYNPIALGLASSTTQQECHNRAYKLYYYQYLLNIFSFLFNHDVESHSRYPQLSDHDSSLIPSSLYDSKCKTNLGLITILLDHIIKDILNTPFNMIYWPKDDNSKHQL